MWNAKDPIAWRDDYLAASEREVATFESLDDATIEAFSISMFGMDIDLVGLLRMRLGESAAHAWDVAVMSDPSATVEPGAVELLVDHLGRTAARGGKPRGEAFRVRVGTTDPQRDLVVVVGESVELATAEPDDSYDGSVDLPAEAFFRLVYGRLDPDHTPGRRGVRRARPRRPARGVPRLLALGRPENGSSTPRSGRWLPAGNISSRSPARPARRRRRAVEHDGRASPVEPWRRESHQPRRSVPDHEDRRTGEARPGRCERPVLRR